MKTKHHTSKIICKKAPTFAITPFSFLSTNTQIITQNTPTLPAIKKATGKKKKKNKQTVTNTAITMTSHLGCGPVQFSICCPGNRAAMATTNPFKKAT